jgi:hypothetical protein
LKWIGAEQTEGDRLRGEARSRKQLAENERQRRLARLNTTFSMQLNEAINPKGFFIQGIPIPVFDA